MIEHHIDDHARYRHVQPDRVRPPCDLDMLFESLLKSTYEGNQSQRNNRNCEYGVGNENGKVNRPDNSLTCEGGRTMMIMIDEVGNKKSGGYPQRRNHATFVCLPIAFSNKPMADEQQQTA